MDPNPGYGQQPWGAGKPITSAFGAVYADWWKRLVAYLIDSVLIWVVSLAFLLATRGLGFFVAIVGGFAYFTLMTGGPRGQTVGMMALSITVRDQATGSAIGYGRSFLRYLIMVVLGWILFIPLLIDCLWPLWDPNRQAWHDKAASSVVVNAP